MSELLNDVFSLMIRNIFTLISYAQINFDRETEQEDGTIATKHIKRTLFQRGNPYPQRKVITFNRFVIKSILRLDKRYIGIVIPARLSVCLCILFAG